MKCLTTAEKSRIGIPDIVVSYSAREKNGRVLRRCTLDIHGALGPDLGDFGDLSQRQDSQEESAGAIGRMYLTQGNSSLGIVRAMAGTGTSHTFTKRLFTDFDLDGLQ